MRLLTRYCLSGFILPVLFAIAACTKPGGHNREIKVQLKDSVTLQMDYTDSLKGKCYIYPYLGKPTLFMVAGNKDAVFAYELAGPGKGRRIALPVLNEHLRHGYSNIMSFTGPDSLFLFSRDSLEVKLVTVAGEVKKTWKVNPVSGGKELDLYEMGGYDPVRFNTKDQLLYFANNLGGGYSLEDFSAHDFFAALKLQGDSAIVTTTFGHFPAFYKNRYYGYGVSKRNLAYFNHQLLASYYLSDSLYVFDAANGYRQPIAAYNAASPYVEPTTDIFDESSNGDHAAITQFSCGHSVYYGIVTRPSSKYLFRMVVHKYNYYNEDSTVNSSGDRPFSIIVLNEDLKKLGELSFPEKKLSYFQLIPYGKGFWIAGWNNLNKFYYYEMEL